jgi:hypothetical protein
MRIVTFSIEMGCANPEEKQQVPPLRSFALPFVIPTEANPDFLLRCARQSHVCGFQ